MRSWKGVFCFFLIVYLFCAAGYVDTMDAIASIETAEAIVERFSLQIVTPHFDPAIHAINGEGKIYSKLGPLFPFLYVPAVLLSKFFSSLFEHPTYLLTPFFVSLINPILTALLLALFFSLCQTLKLSVETSWLLCLGVGLGTLILPYSKSCQREIVQAISLLGTYGYLISQSEHKAFKAGVYFGLGILAKAALIVALLPALILLPKKKSTLINFSLPIAACFGLLAAFSYHSHGAIGFGYSSDTLSFNPHVWSTPFFYGLYRQLFSFDSGLFYYCPLLILALATAIHLRDHPSKRKHCVVIVLCLIAQASFYATWWTPLGGASLGPRYLVPVIPVLFLIFALNRSLLETKIVRLFFVFVLIFSCALQGIQVSVKPQQYWTLRQRSQADLLYPHWYANIRMFAHKLDGSPERYPASWFGGSNPPTLSVTDVTTLQGFNFWWAHYHRHTTRNSSPKIPRILSDLHVDLWKDVKRQIGNESTVA